MLDKKIINLLKPLRIKIFVNKLIQYGAYSLVVWAAISLVLVIISRILPIPFLLDKSLILMGVIVILGILYSLYKFPSYRETAVLVDNFGLKERVITALELKDNDFKVAILQKQDTVEKLQRGNFNKKIPIKIPVKIIIITLVLIMGAGLVGFIPTKSSLIAKEIRENTEIIKEEKEKVEKIQKEIQQDKKLTIEDKKKIEKRLKELKKSLDNPRDLKTIQKELKKTMNEIDNIQEDMNKIQKEVEKISKALSNMSNDNLKKTVRELEKLVQNFKDNKELMESINHIAQAISQGSKEDLSNLSKSIANEINKYRPSNSLNSLRKNLEDMDSMVSKMNSDSNGSSTGKGQGSKDNNSSNKGQGSKSNSGSGKSKGNSSIGRGQGNGTKGNSGGSSKNVEEYEKIYTTNHINDQGERTDVKGQMSKDGNKDIIEVKRFGDRTGESIPYNEVINQYKNNAYEKLNSEDIPLSMKEIVREYFANLE